MHSIQLDLTEIGLARTSSINVAENSDGNSCRGQASSTVADSIGRQSIGPCAAHVDADATVGDPGLGALVGRDRRRGVHAITSHTFSARACPCRLRAASARTALAPRISNRSGPAKRDARPDIVKQRADVEHLEISTSRYGLGTSHERGELKASLAVCGDMRLAAVVNQVARLAGERRIRRNDREVRHVSPDPARPHPIAPAPRHPPPLAPDPPP